MTSPPLSAECHENLGDQTSWNPLCHTGPVKGLLYVLLPSGESYAAAQVNVTGIWTLFESLPSDLIIFTVLLTANLCRCLEMFFTLFAVCILSTGSVCAVFSTVICC